MAKEKILKELLNKLKCKLIMKKRLTLIIFFVALTMTLRAQQKDYFKTDVATDLKPWTSLDFYNDPSNFQFAIVSDNTGGSRHGIFDTAVEKLNMMMPEFVLSVGDLIQGYTRDTALIREEWEDFNRKVAQLKMPFFYLPGNHDITNRVMQKEWEKRYGRRYYYFVYKNVLFVILDSNDDDDYNLTTTQVDFALEAVNGHPEVRWTFVLMHHPIWKYDTNGRFHQIEAALAGRNHTVIAGHEHHFQHYEKEKNNYYVLATTGGGSRLRGNRFGEFDHFAWITMTDSGPVMANLRLDGILSHDIVNEETIPMAYSMLDNTNFRYLVLTNVGEKFRDGTVYFYFENKAKIPLKVEMAMYHHHQADVVPATVREVLEPGEEKIIEISLKSHKPESHEDLGVLQYYWKLSYESPEYKDFYLDGKADFKIEASKPDFFKPATELFVESVELTYSFPYPMLKTNMTVDGNDISGEFSGSMVIDKSSDFSVYLTNSKEQRTRPVEKSYEKTTYLKGKKNRGIRPGLNYMYYEGAWSTFPDFSKLKPVAKGTTMDYDVMELAKRQDDFGIVFTGWFEAPEDGLYFIRCNADDAVALKIHGKLVCMDARNEVQPGDRKADEWGVIALGKGLHPLTIEYVERTGNKRLRLYIKRSEDGHRDYLEVKDYFRIKK